MKSAFIIEFAAAAASFLVFCVPSHFDYRDLEGNAEIVNVTLVLPTFYSIIGGEHS